MSRSAGNVREILNGVELLVKNIKRKRDLLLHQLADRQCLTTDQICRLLNAFVDQILDDSDADNSDEQLTRCIANGHSHEDKDGDRDVEKELRVKVAELEATLLTEKKNLERIQKHCGKIMTSLQVSQDKHKKEMNALQQTIDDLKMKNSELVVQVTTLEASVEAKPDDEPIITMVKSEEVKREMINKHMQFKRDFDDVHHQVVNKLETLTTPLTSGLTSPKTGQLNPVNDTPEDGHVTVVNGDDSTSSREASDNGLQSTTFIVVEEESDSSSESEDSEEEMPSTELKEKAMTSKLSISMGNRVPSDKSADEVLDSESDSESDVSVEVNGIEKTNGQSMDVRSSVVSNDVIESGSDGEQEGQTPTKMSLRGAKQEGRTLRSRTVSDSANRKKTPKRLAKTRVNKAEDIADNDSDRSVVDTPSAQTLKRGRAQKKATKRLKKSAEPVVAVCANCGYRNPRRNQMTHHIRLCQNKTPDFRCHLCGTLYFTVTGLRLHLKGKHGVFEPSVAAKAGSGGPGKTKGAPVRRSHRKGAALVELSA